MRYLHRRDLALGERVPRARSVAHQVDQHVHALIVDDARRLVGLGLGLGLGPGPGPGFGLGLGLVRDLGRRPPPQRTQALRLEETLRERIAALPPADFEDILHSVFKEDEWKLFALGGAMGLAIGLAQAYALTR